MDSSLKDNMLTICSVLSKHSVQFLVVGGTAVALHGYIRASMNASGQVADKQDLDFWYNPTYENYFRLLNALEELGQDVSLFKSEKEPKPKQSFFRLEYPQFTLDFLPELIGIEKFIASFERREIVKIADIEIGFLAYNDIVANKEATARPKDINDLEQLKSFGNKGKSIE